MKANTSNILLVVAVASTLVLAGCIDSFTGTGDGLEANMADGNGAILLKVNAENLPDDLQHLELVFSNAWVHDAATTMPEGYVELSTNKAGGGTIVHQGTAADLKVAEGQAPAGEYDQILLRMTKAKVMVGNVSGEDHDGHDHTHADDASDATGTFELSQPDGVDLPVNLTFEVLEGKTTEIELVFDADAATADGTFVPVIARATITRDGNLVTEATDVPVGFRDADGASLTSTPKPVARIAVFGPDGAQVFKPDFLAEDGTFVNSPSSAFKINEDIRFSAAESEAVDASATIESYLWDFGNGNTSDDQTAVQSFAQPGVFEITLTVTDSLGARDSHLVRIIVLATEWTATLVEETLEDGADGWTATAENAGPLAGVVDTTWALGGPGQESDTAWRVGHHIPVVEDVVGYTGSATATLKSPVYTIPAEWSSAGFSLFVNAQTEACCDTLAVSYTAGGDSVPLGSFGATGGWIELGEVDALASAAGQEIQFTFTFTSDGIVEQGFGASIDNLVIGGVDLPLKNPELLELAKSGSDGHDHEH